MTREIKFRAWDKNIEKMCKVEQLHFIHRRVMISFKPDKDDEDQGNGAMVGFEDVILMQFTGLKDKNGKEVYEGDVVKVIRVNWYCPSHPEHNTDLVDNHLVIYSEEDCAFKQKTIDLSRGDWGFCAEGFLLFNDERADENIIEVIGNIYENPELLEGAK